MKLSFDPNCDPVPLCAVFEGLLLVGEDKLPLTLLIRDPPSDLRRAARSTSCAAELALGSRRSGCNEIVGLLDEPIGEDGEETAPLVE